MGHESRFGSGDRDCIGSVCMVDGDERGVIGHVARPSCVSARLVVSSTAVRGRESEETKLHEGFYGDRRSTMILTITVLGLPMLAAVG